jgi:hypothetical protein
MRCAAFVTACILLVPVPAPAQERFEPVPLPGNLNDILRRLLLQGDEEHGLQRLFERLRNDPRFPPELLKQLDTDMIRPQLRELAQKFQADGDLTGGDWAALQRRLELNQRLLEDWKAQFKQGKILDGIRIDPGDMPDFRQPIPQPAPQEPLDPDRLARWTRDLLRDIDETRVGDFLRESPAWQRALTSLEQSVRLPSGKLDWLGKLPEGWGLPQGWLPQPGSWPMGRLPVSLPRWRFSPPRLGGFNPGLGGGPRLGGGPSLGGAPDTALAWALVPVLLGLLAWLFYRQLGRAPGSVESARRLGPWPVDPARIATRTELIQAFEYLARFRLGDEVLSWNHRAVAQRLGQDRGADDAGALAQLYELARYTVGDEALAPSEQTAARRCLAALRQTAY